MGFPADEVTGHGFRATARTMLHERLGFDPNVIEAQLAHSVRDNRGRAYNRTEFVEQRPSKATQHRRGCAMCRARVSSTWAPCARRSPVRGAWNSPGSGRGQDPLDGKLFPFVNRRATQIKVLYFDRSGWRAWANQLSSYCTSS